MKVRRFKIENGKAFVDDSGDFLHINDIVLLLKQKRDYSQRMVNEYKDCEVEWQRKCCDMNQQRIDLIDELLSVI
jgi:hypothetical protein